MGWKGQSRRHSLARKGVKTSIDQGKRFDVSNFVAKGNRDRVDDVQQIDYNEMMQEVEQYMIKQEMLYAFTIKMEKSLEKFEGKPISRRMLSHLKKEFPDHTFYYDDSLNFTHIEVKIPDMPYANDTYSSFNLGYDNESGYSTEKFMKNNQWAYLEKVRSEELRKKIPQLKEAVKDYNKGAKMINTSRDVSEYDGYKSLYPLSKYFKGADYRR